MPTYRTLGYLMIDVDYSFKSKYWRFLSDYFIRFYGKEKITDPFWVQKILINCFGLLSYDFRDLIKNERRASFYVFVQNFHENSIILWKESIENNSDLKITKDFPGVRRILKLILEEATLLDLIGHPNFINEIKTNLKYYIRLLEEILYVGIWYFGISEYIAKSKLFPNSISIGIEDNDLVIYENHPYNHLFRYIEQDISKHDQEIVVDNNVEKIKQTFLDSLGVDYNVLGYAVAMQPDIPGAKFGLINLETLKENICNNYHYNREIVDDFYAGLTLSRDNTPSLDQRILSNQENHRIIYRPILKYIIDYTSYEMIGYNKWLESFTSLSANAIPWGKGPEEWMKYDPILNLFLEIQNNHDKVLEDPVKELLAENDFIFDTNIKTILQKNCNNIRIDKEGIGEIDIIYIDEAHEQIFVCECKHNRSRFDFNNWRRDYSNFITSYESQLEKKVNWCSINRNLLNGHFHCKFNDYKLDLSSFTVKGIFIINAPTLYMYDGKYKAFTLHDFKNFLKNKHIEPTFKFLDVDIGKVYEIKHPFFHNIDEL